MGLIPGLGRCPEEGDGSPLQYFCLGNPMDRGAWRATVPGITESGGTKHVHVKYINKEKEIAIVFEGTTICLHVKAYSMLPKY